MSASAPFPVDAARAIARNLTPGQAHRLEHCVASDEVSRAIVEQYKALSDQSPHDPASHTDEEWLAALNEVRRTATLSAEAWASLNAVIAEAEAA